MLRSRNQTTNQIPHSSKNDAFDWAFDLVIVTWKNNHKNIARNHGNIGIILIFRKPSISLLPSNHGEGNAHKDYLDEFGEFFKN